MMRAAFFDLDKTVIAKASIPAFGRPLYRGGLINRRLVARALVGQIIYLHLGASEQKLARIRESMLMLTKGWEHDQIKEIVREALEETVEPIIYAEALDLIEAHRAAGYKVYLVSASPEVIVAPLAEHLGVDGAIASRPVVDEEGRYTGEMEFYAYGPFKAEAIQELARQEGLDLEESSAYSDSYTDLPMLEAVGHPVAVNPDRVLAKVARRARLGGHAVHQAGPVARQGQRSQLVDDRRRGRCHRRRHCGRAGRLAAGPTAPAVTVSVRRPTLSGGPGLLRKDGAAWRRRHPGQR